MFYPKQPRRMLWYVIGSQKHKVHKFFHIEGVVSKLWMFPQCRVVSLEKQSRFKKAHRPRLSFEKWVMNWAISILMYNLKSIDFPYSNGVSK